MHYQLAFELSIIENMWEATPPPPPPPKLDETAQYLFL